MEKTNTELILIRISGLDRPGLTASITEILSRYEVDIMDIGQADIHSTLSLGILFKCNEKDSGNVMKDLLFKASELGINIRFYPISAEEYEEWVNMQGKNRYILTLLGRKLTAQQIAGATQLLADQGLRRAKGKGTCLYRILRARHSSRYRRIAARTNEAEQPLGNGFLIPKRYDVPADAPFDLFRYGLHAH